MPVMNKNLYYLKALLSGVFGIAVITVTIFFEILIYMVFP